MKNLLKKKIKANKLKFICRQYSSMSKAGCDYIFISEKIAYFYDDFVRQTLLMCKRNLQRGNSLSQSFALTNEFSNLFVGMIYAGEISGNVEKIFEKLSYYYEREDRLRKNIVSASIYPLTLCIISFISFIFILLYVVPNFQLAFSSSGANIENNTIFVMSAFLRKNIILSFTFLVIFIFLIIYQLNENENIKEYISRSKYKIPKLRKISTLILTENFARTLSILISSGVNLEQSIDILCSISKERYIKDRLNITKNNIKRGQKLSSSLAISGVFPNLFISMIVIGENTGTIEENLLGISKYYEESLDIELNNFIKIIEPAMIIIIGLVIGIVMISILSPMLDLISTIK
ncbi:type II secretion system F family protein [Peptostreptococcus equinus]|uniref:Type II secretion system F family protein n=1 Tax=Peptostreptococcus equinus TaxID=3003601 RepID=A0ABY7JPF2_9FIRM|nr:type II secretion system F family protein [Peptostreptococcus sp. CBA3647]WAW15237.1 type II secretion system F family protein [Peptostreptococcus sp. CBA3647]